MKNKKEKVALLNDLFNLKVSLQEVLDPTPECVILYDATFYDNSKSGFFLDSGAPKSMVREANGLISRATVDEYNKKHPQVNVVCFVLQTGNEPLEDETILD